MKKYLWLLLLPALLLSACVKESPEPIYVPAPVAKEDRKLLRTTEVEGIFYALYNDNTCEIVEADPELYDAASLTLPSYFDSYTVIAVADGVFEGGSFTHVTLPVYLETIGKSAFRHSQITELSLPDSLVSLGEEAFDGCVRLEKITFGKGLTEIPAGAFYGCRALKELNVPEGVTAIGEEAFGDLISLEKLSLPDSLTEIGRYAFWHSGTESLTFSVPDAVSEIGAGAFRDTAWFKAQTEEFVTVGKGVLIGYHGSAESVTLPDSIRFVSDAFAGTAVKTLTLPEHCKVGEDAFTESRVETLYQNGTKSEVTK